MQKTDDVVFGNCCLICETKINIHAICHEFEQKVQSKCSEIARKDEQVERLLVVKHKFTT